MNPNHALLPDWMFRWVHRGAAAPSSTLMHSRIEVCPPQLWPSSLTWRGRVQRWLASTAPWLSEPQRPVNRLAAVKDEFLQALSDLPSASSQHLSDRIARARSLRELWHLRSQAYNEVATARTQAEAERRLARLNRHFPMRAPRTGPSTLDH
jgi:hypothetical protein